jgi:hypothetical protein
MAGSMVSPAGQRRGGRGVTRVSIDTARQLLDFAGGSGAAPSRISKHQAEDQLQGAVAIHNLLAENDVAYLADEVGMGKTYVALGAFALFRHFNPTFRLLVIAPKQNIQEKWIKELKNFVRNNVRFADRRIKAIHDMPARSAVLCHNLKSIVHETALDPDRDFFARFGSFSFGLGEDTSSWQKKRDELLKLLPWLDRDLLDLRSKDRFKDNYARAVCCALPVFDLVIVDEGHNLKRGLSTKAYRNRLLALAFGRELDGEPTPREFRHYGPRAKKLLLLSATPLEDDYRHVWNQLDVFGMADKADGLQDLGRSEEEKKAIVSRFLIRRVNEVRVGSERLTKNLYRREWRGGGVSAHDDPLETPDPKQQLVVALVQKKVSELLESERFNHSFQIGMLASFESFLQTAKVQKGDESTFDDADQTEDLAEREGIDVDQVNRLAKSYWREFQTELPHPKMDALVEQLTEVFESGEKALVFVRRVASVKELRQKLETAYDHWLLQRLRGEIRPELQRGLEEIIGRYQGERRSEVVPSEPAWQESERDEEDPEEPAHPEQLDPGGNETFFAWFFRGDGPKGVLSGAELAARLSETRFGLSSFFLDNWVAALLQAEPGQVFEALVAATGADRAALRNRLEEIAGRSVRTKSRYYHRELFLAFQFAALKVLAEQKDVVREKAATILRKAFDFAQHAEPAPLQLGSWLEVPTFFTELRRRPELRNALWPEERADDFRASFRRSELRRELISSTLRLGHALIDFWVLYVNQLGRLESRGDERVEHDAATLASALLDLLESQRTSDRFGAWRELREAAEHFDLIVDTNAPSLWERPLAEIPTEVGKLLRAQQPIGGMFGAVNKTLVRQFRMPGYPFLLITTDLLQEGEDLHLFCSRVYHYGINWMPSSMEQRTGRVDRVRSLTERRLTRMAERPGGDDLLQVFYPYLQETVEVFQVERVFERLNRFMRLMHEKFGEADDDRERKIDVRYEASNRRRDVAPILEPLRSAFPVDPGLVRGPKERLAVEPSSEKEILSRFQGLKDLRDELPIEWSAREARNSLVGTWKGERQQSFTLVLHSVDGMLTVRCISPIGWLDRRYGSEEIAASARPYRVRIGAVYDKRFEKYDLTAEGDVLLGAETADRARVRWLIETVVHAADRLEEALLEIDAAAERFHEDLAKEATFER